MYRPLTLLSGLLFICCAHSAERIVDTRDGSTVSREQLIEVMAGSEFVLLGELHDNAAHHRDRGELLTALNSHAPSVVAEHLESGKTVVAGSDLQADLERAGFDAKGWGWPLHQPLFAAVIAAGMPLSGGNIPRATARNIARAGASALPEEIAQLTVEAPLDAEAREKLDADLLHGHCGQLDAAMLPGLRLAQRARDATMFNALRSATQRPSILVAGNGHVRLDYGVPSLIRHYLPNSRFVSIGFAEEPAIGVQTQYHYLWITEPTPRSDPCATFKTGSKAGK
jgi:uncharacterized iron-regulated protein